MCVSNNQKLLELKILILFLSSCFFLEIMKNPLTNVPFCASSMEYLLTVKDKDDPVTMEDKTGIILNNNNNEVFIENNKWRYQG